MLPKHEQQKNTDAQQDLACRYRDVNQTCRSNRDRNQDAVLFLAIRQHERTSMTA